MTTKRKTPVAENKSTVAARAYAEKHLAEGWKRLNMWLTPAAVKALEKLQKATSAPAATVVAEALVEAASALTEKRKAARAAKASKGEAK